MKKTLILILSILAVELSTFADDSRTIFKIVYNNDSVGFLTAEKIVVPHGIQYLIKSNVEVRMLFKLDVNTKIYSLYEDNKLIESSHISSTNKNVFDDKVFTKWKNSQYEINKNNRKFTLQKPISYSVNKLYFVEPVGYNSIYAEDQGKYLNIKKINANTYELFTSENKSNFYKYLGGRLVEVEVEVLIGTIKFIRIETPSNFTKK